MSRVLKSGENQITCTYAQHCANVDAGRAWAKGIDVVKYKSQIDKITVHSTGRVLRTVDYLSGTNGVADKAGMGYGNYIMILHENNYVTLYAHLESVYVHEGQAVNQGDIIGLMGNTGNSFGAHLHFEVRKYKGVPIGNLHNVASYEWLDAEEWLDKELPGVDKAGISGAAAKPLTTGIKAGMKVQLKDTPVYNSESAVKPVGTRTGTYFVWSDEVRNGRVRMTNSVAKVGESGQVSFWVNAADIGGSGGVETADDAVATGGNEVKIEEPSKAGSGATEEKPVFEVKTGVKVHLKDTPVYNSESASKPIGTRMGTYFVWSDEVRNNRIRMTNSGAKVGVGGQVSFWADVEDIKALGSK